MSVDRTEDGPWIPAVYIPFRQMVECAKRRALVRDATRKDTRRQVVYLVGVNKRRTSELRLSDPNNTDQRTYKVNKRYCEVLWPKDLPLLQQPWRGEDHVG